MATISMIPDTADEELVRLGSCFVSPGAAQLQIFGVLLGAHLGNVGYVPDTDLDTLPLQVRRHARELVDARVWWREGPGFRIDPDYAIRTMRDSLDRLNDPAHCVATGSAHVRSATGGCAHCGAQVA